MNRVEISGGLVRDPELRFTTGGYPVLEFTVAVNEPRYDSKAKEQVVSTSYIAVNVWGPLAEQYAEEDWQKGDEVYVLGGLDQRTVEKRDGTKEQKTRVSGIMVHCTKPRSHASSTPPPRSSDQPPPSAYEGEEPF